VIQDKRLLLFGHSRTSRPSSDRAEPLRNPRKKLPFASCKLFARRLTTSRVTVTSVLRDDLGLRQYRSGSQKTALDAGDGACISENVMLLSAVLERVKHSRTFVHWLASCVLGEGEIAHSKSIQRGTPTAMSAHGLLRCNRVPDEQSVSRRRF
jgi:hypothetical protein